MSWCSQTLQTFGKWLNSIAFQGPDAPLFIVGTHKDELESPDEKLPEAQQLIHKYMKDMFVTGEEGITKNIRRPTEGGQKQWFFAVDSKSREAIAETELKSSDEGIINLRRAIQEAVQNDRRMVKGLRQ